MYPHISQFEVIRLEHERELRFARELREARLAAARPRPARPNLLRRLRGVRPVPEPGC